MSGMFRLMPRLINHGWWQRWPSSTVNVCVVIDDFFQIVQRLRSKNYFAAHESTNLRASSGENPSSRAACPRAFWTPASNSISRAISASDISSGNPLTNLMTVSRLLMLILSTAVEKCKRGLQPHRPKLAGAGRHGVSSPASALILGNPRLSASRGTHGRHSRIAPRCDTQKHDRTGNHQRARRQVF